MSKTEYVQLESVREALEKVISSETEIEKILNLLSTETVAIDETVPVSTNTEEAPSGEEEGDDVKPPKQKQQYVILVSDPKKEIKSDLTGWVLQIPEDEDCREVVNAIKKASYNFNASKKGNKYPVSSIGQSIASLGSKWFKPYDVKVKTKEAVYVVTTDNVLPKS